MATVDQANNVLIEQVLPAGIYTSTPTIDAIDCQGFEAVTLVLNVGAYTDGNYAIFLEDSPDDDSDFTIVLATSGLLLPLNANGAINPQVAFPYSTSNTNYTITSADHTTWDNATWWVGYVGVNRYIQPQLIVNAATDGCAFSMDLILGWPHTAPTRLYNNNQVG